MALQTVEGTKLYQQFKGYMLPPDVIEAAGDAARAGG